MSVIAVAAVLVVRACKAAGRRASGSPKPAKGGTFGVRRRTISGRGVAGSGRDVEHMHTRAAVGIVIEVNQPVDLPDGL